MEKGYKDALKMWKERRKILEEFLNARRVKLKRFLKKYS